MAIVKKSSNPDDFQDVPGFVAAMSMTYASGAIQARHAHKRAQLLFAVSGVMWVSTSERHWLLPPQRALWIPPNTEHEMRARTDVELRNLYVRMDNPPIPLPHTPTLIYVTPLLRELVVRAVELPIEEGVAGAAAQIVALIFSELQFLPSGEFDLPRVHDPRLVKVEEGFKKDLGDPRGIEEWAALGNMSSRTLGRKLKAETGLSFAAWRQQIRLTEAVVRLVKGEAVTSVALTLGYENTGSFSRMFKKTMGISPSELASQAI
ncbi:helix-turn-helix transcriptional regulator [Caballeronia sp. LjRoot34]|uniref:AraC family transcriptional regulator n=1 Tax=Caballeronia sp. LjRoot34 TaxID=3342325 RepID=UPI003ECEFE0A